ncbi:MAG: glycosyltransferase family 2 protein [Vicinamibacterales bacterium]
MTTAAPPLLSVILSFRNEADLLAELTTRLTRTLEQTGCRHELIFVDDASTDGSEAVLRTLASQDDRVRVIRMSRRFGPSECVFAGLRHASGDAAVFMDTDLQDPPELLPTLITRWREGADVVHTVRTRRLGESRMKMALTGLAYRLIRALADIDLQVEAGDFKLLSRRAVDALLSTNEIDPYLRGLAVWVGFRQEFVSYERQPRGAGVSHFPFFSPNPWRTVLSGLTSFSVLPLLIWGPLGVLLTLAGGAGLFVAAFSHGTHTLMIGSLVVLLAGVQMMGLGVIGLYVARLFRQSRGRPSYIIADTWGWPTGAPPTRPPV